MGEIDLTKEIMSALREYTDDVVEKIEMSANELADKGVKMLKEKSPKDTGEYAKSWAKKKEKDGPVIHNKEHYRRTHLLEHGHAKVDGGRVPGIPHIGPVEKQLIEEYEKEIEKAVKG